MVEKKRIVTLVTCEAFGCSEHIGTLKELNDSLITIVPKGKRKAENFRISDPHALFEGEPEVGYPLGYIETHENGYTSQRSKYGSFDRAYFTDFLEWLEACTLPRVSECKTGGHLWGR